MRLLLLVMTVLTGVLSIRADAVDEAVVRVMSKRRLPGLSLAIVQDGRIVKAQGYGVLEAGRTQRVTADSLFLAGSVSKPVAAFGALALVEAGQLSLDKDVNRFLKTWKIPDSEYTRLQKITLRRLLSHGAGLSGRGFRGYSVGSPLPTLRQILNGEPPANSAAIRPDGVPGDAYKYSGGGYLVVQQLVLDTTDESFPGFMRNAIFEPLGMRFSTFEQPLPAERVSSAATGHTAAGPVRGRWHIYPEMAAGGLWTTASDLATFVIAVQNSFRGKHRPPIISAKLAEEMLTRQMANYGLGFLITGENGSQRFTHSGRDVGFDARLVAYVGTGQGAVVMMNANDDSGAAAEILSAIAVHYSWPDYPRFRWYDPALLRARRHFAAIPVGASIVAGFAALLLSGAVLYCVVPRRSRRRGKIASVAHLQ